MSHACCVLRMGQAQAFRSRAKQPSMFKRFEAEESVSSSGQIKSSVQRGIRAKILDLYPKLESVIEDIMPKKSNLVLVKCQNHLQIVTLNKEPLFFCERDGPYFPTLQLLHKYPGFMQEVQVDRGAIRFVLGGAHVMCPGLTSKGGRVDPALEAETPVAIRAEGKEYELAIGTLKMSGKDILDKNKGIAIETVHYLNDGLWRTKQID